MKKRGAGRVVAIDSDEVYLDQLRRRGLEVAGLHAGRYA
jgi:hypothetical protein